jgi:photosystem II stability/assembly factor-like uncharacterized protein
MTRARKPTVIFTALVISSDRGAAMSHRPNQAKQSIVWTLAIMMMSLLSQIPATAVNAIADPNVSSERPARVLATARASASPAASADPATQLKVAKAYDRLPLSFEANAGQTDDARATFLARGAGYNLFLSSTEATFAFLNPQRVAPPSANKEKAGSMGGPIHSYPQVGNNQAAALRISLRGANKSAKPKGVDELPGRNNYFIGGDPRKWRVNVPTYSRVEYESVYRGVDLVYYGRRQQLEYDFIVAPGASYKVIRIGFDGGDRVSLDDGGDLVIEIGGKKIYQRRPVVYQNVNGIREPIAARYVLGSRGDVGFEIGDFDANRSLVIDPVLSYSTYLGGAGINSVAVDRNGSAYVTGTFPLGDIFSGVSDAFVMKLNPEGTAVLYSTFLGGSDRTITAGIRNQAFGIAVDSNGNAFVTGSTDSKDFPTTPGAFQTTLPGTLNGRSSAFVTRLNSTGDALVYSTYLGGTDDFSRSSGQAIAVDGAGSAYVTGSTDSFKFPLVNPFQSINSVGICFGDDFVFACHSDAFISKLNSSGSALIYSTYLGGAGIDSGADIAVDSAGFAYVVGTTSASGFPTKNPFQSARSGPSDLFIAKLSVAGDELIYSSLLGGSASDTANGIAVDSSGNAYVTGRTVSTDFPTTPGSLQTAIADSTAFKSTDGGMTWSAIKIGLPGTDVSVRQLVVDPINSSTLYASTNKGLLKSTDGGNSWRFLPIGSLATFAIDPTNPSTLYGEISLSLSSFGQLEKSIDGGKFWFPAGLGLTPNIAFSILIDPQDPSTLYAGAQLVPSGGRSAGIFKSTDGGIRWVPSARGVSLLPVSALALAPAKPKRLYAFSGGSIFKSTNGGKRWKPGGFSSNLSTGSLAVDPLNPNTIYLATSAGVSKSTDGAETWSSTTLHENIGLLVVDPKNPSTIYAAGREVTNVNRNFKSTDGGESWKAMGPISVNFVATFAIDPNNASIVYAGCSAAAPFFPIADAFVAKVNPTGTALVYSTYLGGRGDDIARAIKVDAEGNAYLTGQTSSEDFPIKAALQPRKLGTTGSYDVFLTMLDPSGLLVYSTYLGGSGDDDGRAMALDAAGALYIAGSTDSDDFPTLNPLQGTRSRSFGNGFVTKLVNTGGSASGFSQARRSR